ncbi:MAG: LysR family transcriptional regulator [Lachnospiraceae bacterium]|nr:LysR family transcriptional regulator [Lachnospiraceae bacterium]MDD3615199.1 LysR family transcriptional regulator [Lachnospiraceae bacterium]
MEIRTLRYFLKVCEIENITRAAVALNTTQPNLSRQLYQLEEDLGQTLLIRGKRRITLTEEGKYLRKQAQDIINMADHTENVLRSFQDNLTGEVYIGAAESMAMKFVGEIIRESRNQYPGIHYHINSGNAQDITDKLDRGLLDFGIIVEPVDFDKYNYLKLPVKDTWGILMQKASPLAEKKFICPEDLLDKPLYASSELLNVPGIKEWLGESYLKFNPIMTFNLITNAALMIESGGGYVFSFDGLSYTGKDDPLAFRPLSPQIQASLYLIWRKYETFSNSAGKFLSLIKDVIEVAPPLIRNV